MKKILFILLLLSSTLVSRAQSYHNFAEFFIQVNERGPVTVTLNDDVITSRNGRFRFYDLWPNANNMLTITVNGQQLYKDRISLRTAVRMVATYSRAQGFRITDQMDIYAGDEYNLDNWNMRLKSQGRPSNGRPERVVRVMNQRELSQLMERMKNEPFKNEKITIFKMAVKSNGISVNQLRTVIKQFSFDDEKLECILFAYAYTVDTENFHELRDDLSFLSSRSKLDKFISES